MKQSKSNKTLKESTSSQRLQSSKSSLWRSNDNIRQNRNLPLDERDSAGSDRQTIPRNVANEQSASTVIINPAVPRGIPQQLYMPNENLQFNNPSIQPPNGYIVRNSGNRRSTPNEQSSQPYETRPTPTYRLISDALNNAGNNNNVTFARVPPIPAQRFQNMGKSRPTVNNHYQGPNQEPFLYSESRAPHPETTTHKLDSHIQPNTHQPSRRPLPSYNNVQGHQMVPPTSNNLYTNTALNRPSIPAASKSNMKTLVVQTGAAVRESCCGSSNPDSGYGGHSYDIQTNQSTVSPQQAATVASGMASTVGTRQAGMVGLRQADVRESDSWYSQRIQDVARRNTHAASQVQRTMTSDV